MSTVKFSEKFVIQMNVEYSGARGGELAEEREREKNAIMYAGLVGGKNNCFLRGVFDQTGDRAKSRISPSEEIKRAVRKFP